MVGNPLIDAFRYESSVRFFSASHSTCICSALFVCQNVLHTRAEPAVALVASSSGPGAIVVVGFKSRVPVSDTYERTYAHLVEVEFIFPCSLIW